MPKKEETTAYSEGRKPRASSYRKRGPDWLSFKGEKPKEAPSKEVKLKKAPPKVRKPRKRYVHEPHYMVMSANADRVVRGFGVCKKGKWIRVPEKVYESIKNAVVGGGSDVGWKIKIIEERLEV